MEKKETTPRRAARRSFEERNKDKRKQASGNFGTMIFKNNVGEILVLNINETKLVEIFRDYLENMEENCFYSIEESISMLQQIIEHLKKMTDTD